MRSFLIGIVLWLVFVVALHPADRLWTGELDVTTTWADTTYPPTDDWDQVSMWFSGCTGWLQLASPSDTASIDTRDSVKVTAGTVITIGKMTKLRRIRYRADADSGKLYGVGIKNTDH